MNRRKEERRKAIAYTLEIASNATNAVLRRSLADSEDMLSKAYELLARAGAEASAIPWMQRSVDLNIIIQEINEFLPKTEIEKCE